MSRVRIDLEVLNDILKKHYSNKSEMARGIGVSKSHLQAVFEGRAVGKKVIQGLHRECKRLGLKESYCFLPSPITFAGQAYEHITVVGEDNEVLAVISSREIIEKRGTTVIFTPY